MVNIHGHKLKIEKRRKEIKGLEKELNKVFNKRARRREDWDQIRWLERAIYGKRKIMAHHRFMIEELRKKKKMKRR